MELSFDGAFMSASSSSSSDELRSINIADLSDQSPNLSRCLASILQAMPSGIVILNTDGKVVFANKFAKELLAVTLQNQSWRTIINQAFAPQKDDGHEISLRSGRRVKLAITPLSPGTGQLIVLTDLTETRLLQKNLSQLERLSSLGQMMASLAHQIRTPLSAALLYAANLASHTLTQSRRVKFQQKLVDRLNQIEQQISDMLLLVKPDNKPVGQPIKLAEVFDAMLANCEPMVASNKVKISIRDKTKAQIFGNISSLSSALSNLVMNSLEASATKILLVTLQEQDYLRIDIVDNGNGLTEHSKQVLTDPFVTTKTQGTGLGLAVAQSVIAQHEGQFTIKNHPVRGCLVSILLPIYQADSSVNADELKKLEDIQ